ncbi:MAG TPA: hypothetical protein VMB74_08080 [Streptosporangiaceae bacterium]|nr:hypothetical protein [Streptosporangiaceae bacterium]
MSAQPRRSPAASPQALSALATVMLVLSFLVAGLGFLSYRIMTRGQRIDGQQALTAITGTD